MFYIGTFEQTRESETADNQQYAMQLFTTRSLYRKTIFKQSQGTLKRDRN